MRLLIITQKVDQNDQLLGFFVHWIAKLAKKFESILVICLEKGEFDLPSNAQVMTLGKDRRLPKLFWLFNFYKYIFQYRKKYGAVLAHMNPIWMVLGGLCWRLMGKKNYLWYTSGGVTAKLKLAEKLTHVVLTASPESFRLPSKKVIVTGHGVDTDLFKPDFSRSNLKEGSSRFNRGDIDSRLRILSVGRIAPVKNYEVLIEAAKILQKKGVNFSVTMMGEPVLDRDKKYGRSLKQKIADLNLQSHFNFAGKINNRVLASVYQSHDIFVHLSKTGSLDKSLLEAMASGIKVLSSNDWSHHNLPPELTFNENDPLELANKIKNTSQTDFREQLKDYVVKNHNLDGLIEKISSIISRGSS